MRFPGKGMSWKEFVRALKEELTEGKRAGAKLMGDSGRSDTKTKELAAPDPGHAWASGFDAGRAFTAARAGAVAALAALVGAAMWMRRREA